MSNKFVLVPIDLLKNLKELAKSTEYSDELQKVLESREVIENHDVTKLPKLYVLDNGLVNAVSIKYSRNRGQMFENTVLLKLLEQFEEVSYWSELTSEVDFIVNKLAMNVTSEDKIPEREIHGLEEFCKNHTGFSTLLITPSTKKEGIVSLSDFLRGNVDY